MTSQSAQKFSVGPGELPLHALSELQRAEAAVCIILLSSTNTQGSRASSKSKAARSTTPITAMGAMGQLCRVTLFTRANCSLCVEAKQVLSRFAAKRPFVLREVDISKPENQAWHDRYGMDIPVVSSVESFKYFLGGLTMSQLHISLASAPPEDPKLATQAIKIKHRFDAAKLIKKMEQAEKSATRA
jgi:glutaredoxin